MQKTLLPDPAYFFKGRPVYTEEQLVTMDSNYPDETEWVAEIMKRKGKETPNEPFAAS